MTSYIIELRASEAEKDLLLAELMEAGTTGVSEDDRGDYFLLRASFDDAEAAAGFGVPVIADDTDWVAATARPWPSRLVGERFFLAAQDSGEPTPPGRHRLVYQQGAACGSGEHPSTRHALAALETFVQPGARVLDLGCGAGLLSLGAKLLGAGFVAGVDIEEDSCRLTRSLAQVAVIQGSADCLKGPFDVIAANIGAGVLVHLADDILGLLGPQGGLILAGFGVEEAPMLRELYAPDGSAKVEQLTEGEWAALTLRWE
jgi:ribosomal protein L11 methyltransferase